MSNPPTAPTPPVAQQAPTAPRNVPPLPNPNRFIINGVTFDTAATPVNIASGYSHTQRSSLTDDMLIKVCNLAVKCNLPAKITKGLQVSTYDPADLKNKNNFFNFVSSWEGNVLSIESHLKTFCMESSFTLYCKELTFPDDSVKEFYQIELQEFLTNSCNNNGTSHSYVDAQGTTHHRPTKPEASLNIIDGGDIIREWHTMSIEEISDSVKLQLKYVDDKVFRQNLVWSFDYFINSVDADFKAYILSKISSMTPEVGRTGPIVFYLIAKRLLFTSENLAQKVINGFINLRLTHFEGENVSKAIFTVRNVLKFLRFGETNSFAPPTTITIIYDVFRGCSVPAFCNHVQQAQDIILKDVRDPEQIFDHLSIKYDELILADRWIAFKKKASAFVMGDPQTKTYTESAKSHTSSSNGNGNGKPSSGKNSTSSKENVKDSNGKERYLYDRQGNKIDYTPPKKNESHERKKGDKTEYWCSKCARWGNHPGDKHDEFYENLKNNKKNNNSSGKGKQDNANSSSTVRHSVTFAQATSGNLRLAVDPELSDGIDL